MRQAPFHMLIGHCVSSVNCQLIYLAHLKIGLFCLLLIYRDLLDSNPLLVMCVLISFLNLCFVFAFCTWTLDGQTFLISMLLDLSGLSFMVCTFYVLLKKSFSFPCSHSLVFSHSFKVYLFIFVH